MDILTPREDQVMRLVVDGQTEADIAKNLHLAIPTVKSHKRNIFSKMKVKKVAELIHCIRKRESAQTMDVSLAGYWLSMYDFEQHVPGASQDKLQFRSGKQINLELIEESSDGFFSYTGRSLCGVRLDGVPAYEHQFRFRMKNGIVIGYWENSNSSNVGCFQLLVHNDARSMHGSHLGNTNARVVKSGNWTWVKAEANKGFQIEPGRFRTFDELSVEMDSILNSGAPLLAKKLFR